MVSVDWNAEVLIRNSLSRVYMDIIAHFRFKRNKIFILLRSFRLCVILIQDKRSASLYAIPHLIAFPTITNFHSTLYKLLR